MSIIRHNSFRPLYSRITAFKNLRKAFLHIREKGGKTPGIDKETCESWMAKVNVGTKSVRRGLQRRLVKLQSELIHQDFHGDQKVKVNQVFHCDHDAEDVKNFGYSPRGVKEVYKKKANGKSRRISVLCLRDKVISRACYQVLSEIYDSKFNNSNFAYRPRRNRSQAAKHCQQLMRAGYQYWVKADIKDCFGSIKRRRLNGLIKRLFGDNKALTNILIQFSGMEKRSTGIIQGGSLSPFFANIYLDEIDCKLAENGHLFAHYADDYVIACRSIDEAEKAKCFLIDELKKIGLETNDKTKVLDSSVAGLNFCGFKIMKESIGICPQGVTRMREKGIRLVNEYFDSGATIVESIKQQIWWDKNFDRDRPKEQILNGFLKDFRSLVREHGVVLPRYRKYIWNWIEQHEIVELDEIYDAIDPVWNHEFQRKEAHIAT